MEYSLIRSKRKTVAIHITKDARVEVRAPFRMPQNDIYKFIASKEHWISEHLKRIGQNAIHRDEFSPGYGDMLLLTGKEYPIISVKGKKVIFDGAFFVPDGLSSEQIKQAVVFIYKKIAKTVFIEKVKLYSKRMGVSPSGIKITSAKTRWGSCSGKNSINFSWRLIMADEDIIDYVVVHELAHIKHKNHSPRFWDEVAVYMPDYKDKRTGLKALQARLAREDWD